MAQIDDSDNGFLNLGEGFKAECHHLRLYVQVEIDGWTAGVYDTKKHDWIEKKKVDNAADGKERAAQIAALELKVAEVRPTWTAI